jgi:hypothetical protein
MTVVIVAGVLGVITICGGLFLRRLLGEITELRRQITRVDRQMRAQRARESFLRQLLIEGDEEEDGDDGPPPRQKAVANGDGYMAGPQHPAGAQPVRRKRHLGLYIGGAAAAIASLSVAAREAVRAHSGRFTAAVTGATVTAATITLVTVQPWTQGVDQGPPSSAPTVLPTLYLPPTYAPPPATTPRPPRSRAPSASPGEPSPSSSPTPPLSPSPSTTVTLIPTNDSTLSTLGTGPASVPTASPPADSGPLPDVGSASSAVQPAQPPLAPPESPASPGLCAGVSADPLLHTDVCLLDG